MQGEAVDKRCFTGQCGKFNARTFSEDAGARGLIGLRDINVTQVSGSRPMNAARNTLAMMWCEPAHTTSGDAPALASVSGRPRMNS